MRRAVVVVCASLFVAAAALKAVSPCATRKVMADVLDIESQLTVYATLAVIGWEATLGVGLALNHRSRVLTLAVVLTLISFTLFIVIGMYRFGITYPCSCFGNIIMNDPRVSIGRNLVMLAALGAHLRKLSVDGRPQTA